MNWKSLPWLLLLLLLSFAAIAQPGADENKHLSKYTSLVVNNRNEEPEGDSVLRKYFRIEKISPGLFFENQKTAASYLLPDTTKIRKRKTVLRLPLTTGTKVFTDKPNDDESHVEYEYLGQVTFLNAYLVRVLLWEEMQYLLISKKNGATIGNFSAMPIFSADKKRIAVIDADPYETDAGISVYNIINGVIKNRLRARFKNWMPASEENMFWGKDGKLYAPVQYSNKYWKQDGNLNEDYIYVQVTLL